MAAPAMFAVFMRLFFLLFRFIYAPVITLFIGSISDDVLLILSLLTSLLFTVGTIVWTYRQLKMHILEK